MASLRDSLFVSGGDLSGAQRMEMENANKSSLRRGFEAGMVGTDINAMAADEASLRASGRTAEADSLRGQISTLQARQAAVSPEVQSLEQINGVGDALTYAGGAVGQGAASMVDPLAAGTAINAVGRVAGLSKNPIARALSLASQFAAPAVGFGINQRQLKGEFYNDAVQDPTVMANTSAQDLNRTAELYGAGAGALDTLLPAAAARRLVGARGLRAFGGLPGGAKLGLDLLGEGATETGQELGKQQVLGNLNPERDTSGDNMALADSFVGGVLGAGPVSGLSHVAADGHRRAAGVADELGTKAGQVFDTASGAAQDLGDATTEGSKGLFAKAMGLFNRKKGDAAGEDLGGQDLGDQGSQAAPRAPLQMTPEDRDLFMSEMPEGLNEVDGLRWFRENLNARGEAAARYLEGMQDDPAAAELLQRMGPENSPTDRRRAQNDASEFLMRRHEEDALAQRAAEGGAGERAAKAFGMMAARGAVAAGKTAMKLGKAAFSGVQEAASKKNMQGAEQDPQDLGNTLGAYLGSEAGGSALAGRTPKLGAHFRRVGEDMGDLISSWESRPQPKAKGKQDPAAPAARLAPQLRRHAFTVADDMQTAFGRDGALSRLDEMETLAGGAGKPVFDTVRQLLQDHQARNVAMMKAREDRDMALAMLKHASPEFRAEAAASTETRTGLLKAVDVVARGTATPAQRNALAKAVGGKDALNAMLMEYSGNLEDEQGADTESTSGKTAKATESDDVAADEAPTKSTEKTAGKKVYGFHKTSTVRSDNPFAATTDKDGRAQRPRLFEQGTTLAGGENALDKKKADLTKALGERSSEYEVKGKSAWEVLQDSGAQPSAIMTAFRDYLRQDVRDDEARTGGPKMSEDQRRTMLRQAQDASKRVIDLTQGKSAAGAFRLAPAESMALDDAARKYFTERQVAVAEQMVSPAGETMDLPTLLGLAKKARAAVDLSRHPEKGGPQILDQNNIITFQREGKPLHMKADDLVKWAATERRKTETADLEANAGADTLGSTSRDNQFIADLSAGMAAVVDSGLVDKTLPYKTNAQGEQEQFTQKGLPPSLRLATTTVEGLKKRAQARRARSAGKAETETEETRQERVAKDQARGQADNADADQEVGFDNLKPGSTTRRRALTGAETSKLEGMATLKERMAYLDELANQDENPDDARRDMQLAGAKGAEFLNKPGESKTSSMDAAPLDFFSDLQRPAIPDEFSDQRYQSRVEGFDATQGARPPTTPMQARRFADRDAADIAKALTPTPEGARVVQEPGALGRPAEGFAMIEQRLRSAARTSTPDAQGLTGGIHHIYPVVKALSGTKLASYDFSPEEAVKANALRQQAARVLMDAEISPAERVALTRELATAQAAERITAQNVKTALQRIAGEQAQGQATEQGQGQDKQADREALRRLQAEDYKGLDTRAAVDDFLKRLHGMWERGKAKEAELRQERMQAEEQGDDARYDRLTKNLDILGSLDELFAEGNVQTDLGSFYDGVADVDDAQARAMLAGSEVPAQAPKSSAAPSGAQGRNAQDAGAGDNSQTAMIKAKEYLHKVLPGVRLEFTKLTGYSGEWIEAENLVRVSTTSAPGTLQTTYHEAMHAFFSKFLKGNPEAMRTMRSLAENPRIMERVQALLHGHPAAIAQLKDGEERLAYIYQFWAAGLLELPQGRPATIMQKLRKFVRRAAGMITDTERAVEMLQAFHAGEMAQPSAAGQVIGKVLAQGTMNLKYRRKFDKQIQALMSVVTPAETVLANSVSPAAQRLAKQFFTNPGDEGSAGMQPGYLNARRTVASAYTNRFTRIVKNLTAKDMDEVAGLLEAETDVADIPYAPHREAVKEIRALLRDFYNYMTDERGMKVKDRGENYFPVVWDMDKLVDNKQEFIDLVTTKYGRDGKELWGHMVGVTSRENDGRQDVTHTAGVLNPFFAGKEAVELPWFEAEDRAKFLQKDLVNIMTTYFHRGARSAEYTHRFGEDGHLLEETLGEIAGELEDHAMQELKAGRFDDAAQAKAWAERQAKAVMNATAAMEGSLGKDTDEKWRKATSWLTAYQNLRLLPLTLFASFVDPMSMVARGATMREAYDTFLRGMREVFTNWGDMFRDEPKERTSDKWTQLAEDIGAVDHLLFSHHVSEEYSSGYMAPGAKKVNDWLFRVNGMEAWNRGMRSGAVKSAVKFIERHSKLPEIHSARWMQELGLGPADIKLDMDGELITDAKGLQAAGMNAEQAKATAEKVRNAINRWVEGAVLTPNAAQRPSWSSDPRWSFLFHLKQFSYSFHQTILKRAVKEMNHGNMAPIGSFLFFIPAMIAADVTKGLIQGGGELPTHMKGMDMGDWVMHGVERAGFLGVAGLGVDAGQDIWSLAGPGVEQAVDALSDPVGRTVLRAMPLNPLYANMVG